VKHFFIEYLTANPRFYWAVIVTVIVSVCLHELAHGLVAIWRGDRTPIEQHRLGPNPLVHMGPISIVCLFVSGIAWGAMPIDRTRLRGRFAEALVALAGPVMNVLIALFSLGLLALWYRFGEDFKPFGASTTEDLQYLLWIFGYVNFGLAIFNMIPVPPLDGSHILANLSPGYDRLIQTLSMTGGTIVLFILVFSTSGRFLWPAAEVVARKVLDLMVGS
jgi:Zn-dependent protease